MTPEQLRILVIGYAVPTVGWTVSVPTENPVPGGTRLSGSQTRRLWLISAGEPDTVMKIQSTERWLSGLKRRFAKPLYG